MAKQEVDIKFKITGLETYIKDLETLESVLDKVADAQKDANAELEETGKAASKGGGFFKSIGKAGKAAFGGIKTAIAATGLGIFLQLGAQLVEWFNQTDVGAKIIQGSLATVGVVFDKIGEGIGFLVENLKPLFEDPLQTIKDFGQALFDNIVNRFEGLINLIPNLAGAIGKLFSGDFAGAAEQAGNALLQPFTGLEDTIGTVVDVAQTVAETVSEVVADVANEVVNAVNASNALIDAQNRQKEIQAELTVENAKLNQTLETQQKIADDTTRSYEDRKAALDEVNKANEQLADNAVKQAEADLAAIALAESLAVTEAERRELALERADAEAALVEAETAAEIVRLESAQLNRELDQEEADRLQGLADLKTGLALETAATQAEARQLELENARAAALNEATILKASKEELAEINRQFDELEKKNAEELQQEISDVLATYAEEEYQNEVDRILAEAQLQFEADQEKLRQAGATAEQLEQLEDNFEKKKTAITKKGEQDRKALRAEAAQQGLQLAGSVVSGLQALNDQRDTANEESAKKAFKVGKALAITEALINTGLAIVSTLAQTKGGPVVKGIAAAAIGASGLAQVLAIRKQQFQPQGGGGGGATPPAPTVSTGPTFIPPDIEQQEANITPIGQGPEETQLPIKTYVIAGEVTSAQEANAEIENLATL